MPTSEDDDDPWRSVFHVIGDWFRTDSIAMAMTLLSAATFSLGTFSAVGRFTRSTYICLEPIDSRSGTLILQCTGLVLDAVIIILLWRILVWTRTTNSRLRTLAAVLCLSSVSILLLGASGSIFSRSRSLDVGFGSLYAFDVVIDSFAFAALLMSTTFWVCESSPVTPIAITTFLVGIWISFGKVVAPGDWRHNSRAKPWVPLFFNILGAILFTYFHNVRSVVFIKRFAFASILIILLTAGSLTALLRDPHVFRKRHPINDFIYRAHIEHDRWLRHVTASDSLSNSIRIYRERHKGRIPPPNYSKWYEYAAGSFIIDEFLQIDRDLEPFWYFSPQILRKRIDEMATYPGVPTIVIRNGEASASDVGDADKQEDLAELASIISKFAKHLPDMILPINLSPTPRVLPPWADLHSQTSDFSAVADLISRRDLGNISNTMQTELLGVRTENGDSSVSEKALSWEPTRASDFRQMQLDACPPDSRSRTNPQWDISRFCQKCVKDHSQGQLMGRLDKSLETCYQPDLKYLHGFSMTDPQSPPIRKLLPLFGPSKTDEFRDILIPLPKTRLQRPDLSWKFNERADKLFWKGSIGEHAINSQAIRGAHKFRLLHMVHDTSNTSNVVMILPRPGQDGQFIYQTVRRSEANEALPFDVEVNDYSMCMGDNCEMIKQTYGTRKGSTEILGHRYVLLTDEDDGPPTDVVRTLQSGSVPFMSTVFRTWYTERLVPWLHFVPIDVRYHGLHSTLAYFTGVKSLNGGMKSRDKDAEWIAKQGKRWVEKAMAQKDIEIYLFRLLLEWARVIDDNRDKIGYWMDLKGEFQNKGWTQGGKKA